MAKTVATKLPAKQESVPHTTRAQRAIIVEWLEVPANFKLITGSTAINARVVSGVKLKRSDAYKKLADAVTKGSNITWTQDHAKNRYESYIKLYKKTKQDSEKTGWGLSDEDIDNGLDTVEKKLESLCPYFDLSSCLKSASGSNHNSSLYPADFGMITDSLKNLVDSKITFISIN